MHRREGEPCVRCGTTIRKIVVGGRGTYVCARCQPRPRAPRRADAPRRAMPDLGREQVAEAAGAVGGQQLVEAAERLVADHDLRERDIPVRFCQLGATVRVPCQIDLFVRRFRGA